MSYRRKKICGWVDQRNIPWAGRCWWIEFGGIAFVFEWIFFDSGYDKTAYHLQSEKYCSYLKNLDYFFIEGSGM